MKLPPSHVVTIETRNYLKLAPPGTTFPGARKVALKASAGPLRCFIDGVAIVVTVYVRRCGLRTSSWTMQAAKCSSSLFSTATTVKQTPCALSAASEPLQSYLRS